MWIGAISFRLSRLSNASEVITSIRISISFCATFNRALESARLVRLLIMATNISFMRLPGRLESKTNLTLNLGLNVTNRFRQPTNAQRSHRARLAGLREPKRSEERESASRTRHSVEYCIGLRPGSLDSRDFAWFYTLSINSILSLPPQFNQRSTC